MNRRIYAKMTEWKDKKNRKPLVLMGARQVGKTWLMHEFCRRNFKRVHEFNFDSSTDLASIFKISKEPKELLPKLSALSGFKIDIASDVVIFDEIQNCPEALNSLKYFCEKCPQLAILAAGSLLGVRIGSAQRAYKEGDDLPRCSYPVGKVEILNVEPLDFAEFLQAFDVGLYSIFDTISGCDPIPEIFHRKLLDAYSLYLFTGGMPEVVADYLENVDPASTRKLHRDLIALFEDDIVKYGGEIDASKILVVLRSIVPQLAKDNEKFLYGVLREGARARDYEDAIEWLVSARMIRRIHNVESMKFPLAAQEVRNAFKIYHLDIGMLREMAGIPQSALVLDSDFDFKGAFVENYVLQQLASRVENSIWYYAERATREIDFVIQKDAGVVPIEVKAGRDKKGATFKTYVKEREPQCAIRFSTRNLRKDGGFVNIPLYLATKFDKCLPYT